MLPHVLRSLKTIAQTKVKIGPKEGLHPLRDRRNQETYAQVGATHELGIAFRSFLKFPLEYKLPDRLRDSPPSLDDPEVLFDRPADFVATMGEQALSAIDEAFETEGWGWWEPLAEDTVKEKAKYPWLVSRPDHILVEGGDLRASVTMQFMK